jgi:hypothetical protein
VKMLIEKDGKLTASINMIKKVHHLKTGPH